MRRFVSLPGLLLMTAGLGLALFPTGYLDRSYWIPVDVPLPTREGGAVDAEFEASEDGFLAVEIAALGSIGGEERKALVTEKDSHLVVEWQLTRGGTVVASGDSRVYLYVRTFLPSRLGEVRRALVRDPFARDEAHWKSLGLSGGTTLGRGIGRFPVEAGGRYVLQATAKRDYAALEPHAPRLLARREPREWEAHVARARPRRIAGVLVLFAGAALVGIRVTRSRRA